jgi:hypothetical protein
LNWSQPLRFDEDDVKEYDLNAKFMVCDVHEMRTKLVVVSEVIFNETHYKGRSSHVLEENFRIGVKVDVFVLQIKVMK